MVASHFPFRVISWEIPSQSGGLWLGFQGIQQLWKGASPCQTYQPYTLRRTGSKLFKWRFELPDQHENSFGKFRLQTSNFWVPIPRSELFSPWANGLVEGETTVFSHQIQICSADLRFTSGNCWEKNHTSHLTTAGLLGNIGYMLGVKVAIILVYMYAYIYIYGC